MTDLTLPPPGASNSPRSPAFGAIGRGWKLLLVASLALNLIVLGIVGGAMLSGRGPGKGPPVGPGFGPYTEGLTHADRERLGRALGARRPEGPGPREDRRADQRALAALLRAEPFDPSRVAALLDGQRAGIDERFRIGQRLLLDLITSKSQEERAEMAQRLEAAAGRGK